jgi:hypothetical protein
MVSGAFGSSVCWQAENMIAANDSTKAILILIERVMLRFFSLISKVTAFIDKMSAERT